MRIAMISYYLPSGSKIGVGYQAHYMANALSRRGHSITMFSPCAKCDDALYEHQQIDAGKRLKTFYFAWQFHNHDFSMFDILHAHGEDHWIGPGRVKCHIKTMHGSCLEEARKVPGIKEKIRMLGIAASEMIGSIRADECVAVSKNTTRSYRWISKVIPNGVDLSRFHPGNEKESKPTILFVGTYQNRKRGKMLMDIFRSQIRPAIPEAQLWMVCNDAPIEPGVSVLGKVELEKLAELYRRAWVFCLPSSYEGFGVPYIEAMASGTAVVATPNAGAREVLREGADGIVVPPMKLGEALIRLLTNTDERDRLAKFGLARANEFGWDVICAQYETLYKQVMGRNR